MNRLDPHAFYLGREAADCDLPLSQPGVSGVHCRITLAPGGAAFLLEDLDSSNGTLLDGNRLLPRRPTPLAFGQTIGLGLKAAFPFTQELAQQVAAKLNGNARPAPQPQQPPQAGRSFLIGRAPECDVVIEATNVSWHHARLTFINDRVLVEDLGSSNGTAVGTPQNRVSRAEVAPSETIFLGNFRFPLERLGSATNASRKRAVRLPEPGKSLILGRTESAGVVVDEPTVSGQHAELRCTAANSYQVRDLHSANGTFINGRRIRDWTPFTLTDTLTLGPVALQFSEQGVRARSFADGVSLSCLGCSVDVVTPEGSKRIVSDVSLTMMPGEFVGLMGPSGAGKTTLLQAINGYKRPSKGAVFVNGLDLYDHFDAFRQSIGYVPQEDIVYAHLTVYETLFATAKLRLPADLSDEEVDRRIREVLATLEIEHVADTIIGDKESKGISGGQRKRVNLAQELLASPRLLFLDEPTSGLSSEDTLNVMRLLRKLADSGRTIILTLHQPSLEAYRLMDNLVLMCEGALVYYGPAYPEAITFMNSEGGTPSQALLDDPGNVLRPLARERELVRDGKADRRETLTKRVARYRASSIYREFVAERAAEAKQTGGHRPTRLPQQNLLRQFSILFRRGLLLKWKDRTNTGILLAQAPIIGLAIALFLGGGSSNDFLDIVLRSPKVLFLLVVSSIWFGCSNAAREIVAERAVYQRERMVNLGILPYLASKVALLGSLCALQVIVLVLIVWNALGLHNAGNPFLLTFILWLVALCGVGTGLLVSGLVRSSEAAVSLLPLILIPQVLAAGLINPLPDMGPLGRAATMVMPSRWGLEATMTAVFGDDGPARVIEACHLKESLGFNAAALPADGEVGTYACLGTAVTPCAASDARKDCRGSALAVPISTTVNGGQLSASSPHQKEYPLLCTSPCAAVDTGEPLTPLESTFGVEPDSDPVRRATGPTQAADRPESYRLSPKPEVAVRRASVILALMASLLIALVGLVLKLRDPLPEQR